MKSAFGSKRKARKIQVEEDEDEAVAASGQESKTENPGTQKPTARKPVKKSNLRQSLAFDDEPGDSAQDENPQAPAKIERATDRSSSTASKTKKKKQSSRLSFGPGEIISGDAAEAIEDDEAFIPKKSTLSRRVIESNALRQNLPGVQNLSIRSTHDDDERPTYSKDYLAELKNSTPNTPKDREGFQASVEDEGLDESELEGAMIVDLPEPVSYIPSEAEIREKKDRRARLAQEQDFISLTETDDERRQLSLLPSRNKAAETRLVREDEDLAEGFDEFVDDGKISLGKKAEREARRQKKKQMAALIQEAEGGSDDDEEDDSDAERRAAYEVSQTRAGMDGLAANRVNPESNHLAAQIPPKISPLPVLSECLERLQATLSEMEQALGENRRKVEGLEGEKARIERREVEVQRLLREAGDRYAALRGGVEGGSGDAKKLVSGGMADPLVGNRGLESFGNTPVAKQSVEDVG